MKRITTLMLPLCVFLTFLQCSEENELDQKRPKEVDLVFSVDGVTKVVTAKFAYNVQLKRYQIASEEITEVEAKHKVTGKIIYVYTLKSEIEKKATSASGKYEIKTGYYGYSAGCFYFGTLYVGDNGESIFVPATGTNAIANPPICPGGQWA